MRTLMVLAVAIAPLACGMTSADENALGDAYAKEIESQLTLSTDSALLGYVDALGRRLVHAAADTVSRDWHFHVVESNDLNAFALPGGHVYVNRGLVARAHSMSELAGVLGHEIAHVTRRHSVGQMEKRTRTNVIVGLFCAVTGWCSGDVAQIAINVGGAALFAKYSRSDEADADSVAVSLLYVAGIDPRGVPAMFERLLHERETRPGAMTVFLSTHPLEEERVERTRALADQWPAAQLDRLTSDDDAFAAIRPAAP
jgi:predicted Zn-dependent protease